MSERKQTRYFVNAETDPVVLQVEGRANYMNCAPVGKLFDLLFEQGRRNFVVDFAGCEGMDSTFLGILAGLGLHLKRTGEGGGLKLIRLGDRNLGLVKHLGLGEVLEIGSAEPSPSASAPGEPGGVEEGTEAADQDLILRAHRSLVEVDEGNRKRFQDVISFLSSGN
ncbi:MAG: STAS domain-containing protein [Puniceicoccaceae bacterium]